MAPPLQASAHRVANGTMMMVTGDNERQTTKQWDDIMAPLLRASAHGVTNGTMMTMTGDDERQTMKQ